MTKAQTYDMPEELTYSFTQDVDCCVSGICNQLEVSTPDGGGGNYIAIKTERWAIDGNEEIDSFCAMLKKCLASVKGTK
jgi:hypothetical protein